MDDTPRTDRNVALIDEHGELVRADFARQLEQDLKKAKTALREVVSWTYSATLRKASEPDNFGGEAREAHRLASAMLRELGER